MRAARWHGRRDLRLDDVPEPTAAPGCVVVEVVAASICGSDLAEYRDGPLVIPVRRPHPLTGRSAPITLGHEWAGTVLAAGPGVEGWSAGDRVCGDACIRCGTCAWCRRGEYNICAVGASVGLHWDGAFAARLAVPAYTLVRLPPDLDFRSGALVEPLAVGLHAVNRGRLQAGDVLAVVGFGMVGAAVALAGRAAGASEVLVVEPRPVRRRLAQQLGARVVDADLAAARRELRALTEGAGADVVVDCAGRAEALGGVVDLARRGGRVVLAGIGHGAAPFDPSRVVYFEREVIGSLGYRHDLERVVALIGAGHLDPAPLLGDPIGLSRIVEDGFERSLRDPEAPLRVFVEPGR